MTYFAHFLNKLTNLKMEQYLEIIVYLFKDLFISISLQKSLKKNYQNQHPYSLHIPKGHNIFKDHCQIIFMIHSPSKSFNFKHYNKSTIAKASGCNLTPTKSYSTRNLFSWSMHFHLLIIIIYCFAYFIKEYNYLWQYYCLNYFFQKYCLID